MATKLLVWNLPVTDESVVDYGLGTEEQQREAAARIEARLAASRASWRALPWYVRLSRTLRWRTYEPRRRLGHAVAALRGIECERDD